MTNMFKKAIKWCDQKFTMEIDRLPPEGLESLPTRLWDFIWFFISVRLKAVLGILLFTEGARRCGFDFRHVFWYVGELVAQAQYTQLRCCGLEVALSCLSAFGKRLLDIIGGSLSFALYRLMWGI